MYNSARNINQDTDSDVKIVMSSIHKYEGRTESHEQ